MAALPTVTSEDAPPPTYAPVQPQILVAPLPDLPSFFWGRTVQGEVFVKGLGEGGSRGVRSLTVTLSLTNHLPPHASVSLHPFPAYTLYPLPIDVSSPSSSATIDQPFPSSHRFFIPLPPALAISPPPSIWPHPPALPGTLDLSATDRGEVRWSLAVHLALTSGEVVTETIRVEGTPQDLGSVEDGAHEVGEMIERGGVRARLVLDTDTPRLGDLIRAGVEVVPKPREKTGLAGLVAQTDPADTLRPLRRVRVELFRRIDFTPPSSSRSGPVQPHLTLLHSTGKSMRYPGTGHPPLRVLFTLRTSGQGGGADPTWSEISSAAAYHLTSFFVRVTIGFAATMDGSSSESSRDWVIERPILVRPRLWVEPTEVLLVGGLGPGPSLGPDDGLLDEDARAAYRLKGRDVVGSSGTYRLGDEGDMPPPFESASGPSSHAEGLPTFVESEAQARAGEAPLPQPVASERLAPVFPEGFPRPPSADTLGAGAGELGSWVEYDGYETFSLAPPPATASYGVGGSMDPPREGDEEDARVVGGIVTRLGLGEGVPGVRPTELMEQLGLGEGTRVVDLQDDLPPGIDEPSLPALPGFGTRGFRQTAFDAPPPPPPPPAAHEPTAHTPADLPPSFAADRPPLFAADRPPSFNADHPPSFAASEAAEAAGGVARSRSSTTVQPAPAGEAPPGYFGGGGNTGGPPAYS
ncbi:hypothetical protein Q5752_006102 [Cryptotrichosporon argae]